MKNKEYEVQGMTDKQFAAHIATLKFIAETTNDIEAIKNALDKIQDVLKNPK